MKCPQCEGAAVYWGCSFQTKHIWMICLKCQHTFHMEEGKDDQKRV